VKRRLLRRSVLRGKTLLPLLVPRIGRARDKHGAPQNSARLGARRRRRRRLLLPHVVRRRRPRVALLRLQTLRFLRHGVYRRALKVGAVFVPAWIRFKL